MLSKSIVASTVIFISNEDKKKQLDDHREGEGNTLTKEGLEIAANHTLRVSFNFDGVTEDQIGLLLTSNTNAMKMLRNNVLKYWNEDTILEECKKAYSCKVKELLESRKSRGLTDTEKRERFIKNELAKGKSKEELKAELLALLG